MSLWARGVREWQLLAGDLRGWPMRLVHAARLRDELDDLLPWPSSEYQRVLLAGHLPPVAPSPLVSVVVPVYGQLEYTIQCLLSLGAGADETPFEIILVDDASTDATAATLSRCPGIRYLRNETNLGFISSCNRGAAEARGRYLHFLNNDTIALPGWLDQLVDTLESVPDAGLVGSRLIYPGLALQEAGGVVWNDASAANLGNGRDPWNPHYCALRDVDYCSGASVLISKELFDSVGGFDERYRPAYYEDTDLAFEVRRRGKRVLVQPASRIIHHEGGTSGTDLNGGPKRHQVVNRTTFREKWSEELREHGEHGDKSPRALDRFSRSSVLVMDERTPKPDEDGGSVEVESMLRTLRTMGARVTFIPVNPFLRLLPVPDIKGYEGAYTESLQQMGIECPYFPYEPSVRRFLRERGREFDVVVLTRARTADRFLELVRRHCPRAKVVFSTQDLAFLREEREARHTGSRLIGLLARDTKRRELRAINGVDVTLVVSPVEEELLTRIAPGARVSIIPLNREIRGRDAPLEGRKDVLFVGGFKHRPNIDAVEFLVESIWPHVRRALPGARLHIVGSSTPKAIFAMASDDIEVHGFVPDLGPLYAQVRLTVCPVRFGAGIKTKIVESLGLGVPCVATTCGVEGTRLRDGKEILVADDPEEFAQAVVRGLTDDALWAELSSSGLELVRGLYSLEANLSRYEALFDDLGVPHL